MAFDEGGADASAPSGTLLALPMPTPAALRQYQQQAVRSASPAALVDKLYEIGIGAVRAGDAARARRALVELTGALDMDRGGELAEQLRGLYEFSIRAVTAGDFETVSELLSGLREAWRAGPLAAERTGVQVAA